MLDVGIRKEAETGCVDSAHVKEQVRLSGMVGERLLSLASSPALLKEVGAAVPLLAAIVLACGEGDECEVNLHTIAARLGAGHTTLKTWLTRLVQRGVVTRAPVGSRGTRVTLNVDALPTAPAFDDARRGVLEAEGLLLSVQSVVNNAVDGALARLSTINSAA